jgi:radical SAM-linked protein
MRFLSHLDLVRLFGRACRRADLPVSFTEGFSPRPRITFASPLSVGIEGDDEIAVFEFEREPEGDPAVLLNVQMPDGIRFRSAEALPTDRSIAPEAAEYVVEHPPAPRDLEIRAEALLALPSLPIIRRKEGTETTVDVRPFLAAIRREGDRIVLLLRITSSGGARPAEILAALGLPLDDVRIRRRKIILQGGGCPPGC